jgi:hypothetical protein
VSDTLEGFGPPEPDLSSFGPPETGVNVGAAPPVQENSEARRRVLMAVPEPDQPDNLGVFPIPRGPVALAGPGPQAQRPGAFTLGGPDMAAFAAAHGDLSPEQATQALAVARRTGMSPKLAADALPVAQAALAQRETADKLAAAPALAAYAGRGHVEAATVKDSLDELSFLEWAITGRWELATINGDPRTVQRGKVTPPFWWTALKAGLEEQRFAALTAKKATVGLSTDETEALPALRAAQGTAGDLGAHNFATRLMVGTVKALPGLAVLGGSVAAGEAVAGPPGALVGGLVGMFAESFGPLYDRLTQLQKNDGTPLLTDQEARTISFLGAYSTSVAATLVGLPFLQKLPGVNSVIGRVSGEALANVLTRPGVATLLASFGKNYAAGIAMMIAQATGTAVTEEAAKATHGQPADLGRVGAAAYQAGLQAVQDLPLLSAYHPIVGTIGAVARARAEQAHLAGMVAAAKQSPLVARELGVAAEVIEQATGQPGAADTAYVSKEAWDKNWRARGEDPADIAAQVNGDGGRAYSEAEATGGPLAVALEKHLTDLVLSGDAEKLAPDTALSPDGLTPRQADEAAKAPTLEKFVAATPALSDVSPTGPELAEFRDGAAEMINQKPIGRISPGYYEAAAARAAQGVMERALASLKKGTRDTLVITPHRPGGEAVRYEVIEADDLIPSHNASTFAPRADYPAGVQERFYQGQPEEQFKVALGGANLNPAVLLSNTPSPLDGPPLVTSGEKHLVLGGNGRSMMIQRAFADEAVRESYKQQLMRRAGDFGLSPSEIEVLHEPVLVRVVKGVPSGSPKQELVAAVRRFNEGMTQQLSPRARSIAEARTLTPQTVESFGQLLAEHDTSSLRDVLRDHSAEVLAILRRDDVVNAQNQAQWVAGGTLTPDARDRIEAMFLGRVMESEMRFSATSPELAQKLERATPSLLRVAGINPEFDELPTVRAAVDLLNDARQRELPLRDVLAQGSMFGGEQPRDPAVVAMAEMLDSSTGKAIAARFKEWAQYAAVDRNQGSMFGAPPPALPEALGKLFGKEPAEFKGYARLPRVSAVPTAPTGDLPATPSAPTSGKPVKSAEAELLTMNAQHLQAHASAKVAAEVQAEMVKLHEGLGRVDREALGRGGRAYLSAYDAMMGALEGQASAGALDDALALMRAEARPLGFDEVAIADLLANPRPWKRLTPPEARNLADAVASIRKAAKDANELSLGDRRASLREFVADARQHLDDVGVPDKGPPPPSEAAIGPMERARGKLSAIGAEMLRPEVILRRLGDGGGQVIDEFTAGRNAKEKLAREVGDHFENAYDRELPKDLKKIRAEGVDGPGSPVVNDNKWVRQDLWTLAGWFGSESGAQRLRSGLRISDEQITRAIEQLTPAEAQLIDRIHTLNDEKLWPLVRDHEAEVTGTSPPKIEARPFTVRLSDGTAHTFRGGYWPAKSATTTGAVPEGGIAEYWGALRDSFPSTSKSFTKERDPQTSYRPDLNWSSYAAHVNSVLHYLAYDKFVRNAGRLFNDAEFRALVEQRLGTQEMRELDKFASVAARGKVETPRDGANNLGQLIGGGFRSRVATGAFQLNLPIVLGQLSHIPAAMAGLRIAPWHIVQGLGKALVPSSWAEAHANSTQLPYRWNGYGAHMREMLAGIGPGDRPLGRKWLDAAGWFLYHAMDGFLSKTIWESARAKAEAGGLTEPEQYAAADKAVSAMMPPLNIAEQSSIVRDRGIVGSLLLVRNFPNTLYNVGAMNAWQARTGVWGTAPGWQRTARILGGTTAAAAAYLGMTWSAHIFGRFLMGHGRDEDETTTDWLAREAMTAPFYPLPFGEDLTAPLARWAVSDKSLKSLERGFRGAPPIAMLEHSMKDFAAAVDENGTDTDRAFAAAKVAATALRLPLYPLRPARYFADLFAGDVDPRGPLDVLGGAFYGERRPPYRQRNPAMAAQDFLSGE